MPLKLPPGEPEVTAWRRARVPELLELIVAAAGAPPGRPRIIAIDGRGGSGKTTLAARLRREVPASAVVHTDDLAWHEPLFAWGHLLADQVLRPLQQGGAVHFRPPAWERRERDGLVAVPDGLDLVVVEGTGASQREHAGLVDATVWIQADLDEAERRAITRDIAEGVNGDPSQAAAFWHAWMTEELPFFERQRPWERACIAVNGTPRDRLDADHVEIAPSPSRRRRRK
jgi:uridine kinase